MTYDVLYVINKQREKRKKGARDRRKCASVRNSDYWTFVCAMRIDVMSYINRKAIERPQHLVTFARPLPPVEQATNEI